ncbi:hypothetical protein DM860_003847 [Cuscuta australis]|uniref:Uncharacterized protein n=1 Tax=Cuscuta australis TaxID=267555 RepID=A0A328CUV8_9ASTE|nr:hypothetical protein DM860_003847 [Cuscuta australis]
MFHSSKSLLPTRDFYRFQSYSLNYLWEPIEHIPCMPSSSFEFSQNGKSPTTCSVEGASIRIKKLIEPGNQIRLKKKEMNLEMEIHIKINKTNPIKPMKIHINQ